MLNIPLPPDIKFIPFQEPTDACFKDTLFSCYTDGGFIVYLRCKYNEDDKWEYLLEPCNLFNFNDIFWFND